MKQTPKGTNMNNRTDNILNSLDHIQKANAPDYFYTRLIGRMQREHDINRKPFFLLRPAFAATVLLVILLINIFSIVQFNQSAGPAAATHTTVQQQQPTIESFAEAYNLNTESVYE